jgi:hypothetical protein
MTVIYGWDASHYDAVPNMARVISEGFSFMTHKAGGDGNDAELADWWKAAKPHRAVSIEVDEKGEEFLADANGKPGVLVGAYWVLRPDLSGSAVNKADAFLARLDSQAPGWRDAMFILQLDCESWGDSSGKKKPNKAYIKAACDRLRAKAPKLMPIVYASAGDYGDGLSGLGYPLWNARYSVSYRTGTASGLYSAALSAGSGWKAYSGQVPAIWQFTSSATIVGQTTCDANAFRGTLDELTALLAPGWSDDMALSDADRTLIADQFKAVNDRIDALTKETPLLGKDGKTDGTTQTPIGKAALSQGIPDGTDPDGGRQTAWEVIQNLGTKLTEMDAKIDALANPSA